MELDTDTFLIIVKILFASTWITVIASSIWVFFDARAIGAKHDQFSGPANNDPFGWGITCFLVWIVFFPLYLAKRPEIIHLNSG